MVKDADAAAAWPADLVAVYEAEYVGFVQLAFLLLGSRALAEETVQDAFLAVRQRWQRVQRSAGGYVRQAVVNGARARLRRSRVEERHLIEAVPPDAPADLVELREALRHLSSDQRTAIVLRYWADLPDEETAAILGCRVGTVRSHISRGLAQLRREIS